MKNLFTWLRKVFHQNNVSNKESIIIFSFIFSFLNGVSDDEEDEGVHLAPSSADDAPRNANLAQGSADNANVAPSRPSGRVIGIIKRNWHA